MSLDVLKKLFEQHFRATPEHVQPLQGELGGSGRKIIRLANAKDCAIGILYSVREENAPFLAFSKHFRRHRLPVPAIYAAHLAHAPQLSRLMGAHRGSSSSASRRARTRASKSSRPPLWHAPRPPPPPPPPPPLHTSPPPPPSPPLPPHATPPPLQHRASRPFTPPRT